MPTKRDERIISSKGWVVQVAAIIATIALVLIDWANGPQETVRWEVYLSMILLAWGARPETARDIFLGGKR